MSVSQSIEVLFPAPAPQIWPEIIDGGNVNRDWRFGDPFQTAASAFLVLLALVHSSPLLAPARDLAGLGRVGTLEQPVLK